MVYTYINLIISKIFYPAPNKNYYFKSQLLWVLNVEEFSVTDSETVGYVPLFFLVCLLIMFVFLSSTIIWKKTQAKFDLNRCLTKILNQIVMLIIILNYFISSTLTNKMCYYSYFNYTTEVDKVHFIICLFFIIFLIVSWEYFNKHSAEISIEFPILFLISYIAMVLLISTKEIFVWFLALELMSFSFYTLAGYRSKRFFLQTEGSLKYFIIGSIASSLFIFGISLVYMTFGTVDFNNLLSLFYFSDVKSEPLAYFGVLLMLIAVSFKLGIAPFHLWVPEVYYASTSIITFFFLLVPKISLVYLFYQIAKFNFDSNFGSYFFFIYIFTFLIGTLSSLKQRSIDKFLAYSSVANNAWFILLISNKGDSSFLWFYLLVSSILTVLIYAPIINLRKTDNTRLITNLRDLLTLKKTNPTLAILFSMAFFSLAGIPPFLGFFSKFFLLLTSIDKGYYFWVIVAIVFSVFSCYYYIRMIKIIYFSNHLKFSYQKPLQLHTAFIISLLSYVNLFFLFSPKTLLLFFYFL